MHVCIVMHFNVLFQDIEALFDSYGIKVSVQRPIFYFKQFAFLQALYKCDVMIRV